jgi:hypothetical protein
MTAIVVPLKFYIYEVSEMKGEEYIKKIKEIENYIHKLEEENEDLKVKNKYWITNSKALKESREYILEENRGLTKEKNNLQKFNEKLINDLKIYANINPAYYSE